MTNSKDHKNPKTKTSKPNHKKSPKFPLPQKVSKPIQKTSSPNLTSEKSPQKIKKKLTYNTMIFLRVLSYYPSSFVLFGLTSIYPSIINEKNMNLTEEQTSKFLSLSGSLSFVGYTIGYLISPIFSNFSPKLVQRISWFILILCFILAISGNFNLFLLSRFGRGFLEKLLIR